MSFFRKEKEKQVVEKDRIREIVLDIVEIKAKLDKLEQMFKQLRGLVNRKLGNEPKEETESVKKSDGFDSLRGFGM